MRARISARFNFEAAHRAEGFAPDHPNSRVHGHSYTAIIFVEGPVDERQGYVLDLGLLQEVVAPVVARLDHILLNDVPGLKSTSSEHLALWLWEELKKPLPGLCRIDIERPSIGMSVSYRGE